MPIGKNCPSYTIIQVYYVEIFSNHRLLLNVKNTFTWAQEYINNLSLKVSHLSFFSRGEEKDEFFSFAQTWMFSTTWHIYTKLYKTFLENLLCMYSNCPNLVSWTFPSQRDYHNSWKVFNSWRKNLHNFLPWGIRVLLFMKHPSQWMVSAPLVNRKQMRGKVEDLP